MPNFKIDRKHRRVDLHCSDCEKYIRTLKPKEEIAVNRGYYCDDCDDGTIKLNMPIEE